MPALPDSARCEDGFSEVLRVILDGDDVVRFVHPIVPAMLPPPLRRGACVGRPLGYIGPPALADQLRARTAAARATGRPQRLMWASLLNGAPRMGIVVPDARGFVTIRVFANEAPPDPEDE